MAAVVYIYAKVKYMAQWLAEQFDTYIKVTKEDDTIVVKHSTKSEYDNYGLMKHHLGLRLVGFDKGLTESDIRFQHDGEIVGVENSQDHGPIWVIDDNKSRMYYRTNMEINNQTYSKLFDFYHNVSMEYLEHAINVWIHPFNFVTYNDEYLIDFFVVTSANPNLTPNDLGFEDFRLQMIEIFKDNYSVEVIDRYEETPSTVYVRIPLVEFDPSTKQPGQALEGFIESHKHFTGFDLNHLTYNVVEENLGSMMVIGLNLDNQTCKIYLGMDGLTLITRSIDGRLSLTSFEEYMK